MSNIKGLEETLSMLSNQGLVVQQIVKEELQNTGLETLNEAKSNTPVDTGNLRQQSNYEATNQGFGFKISFSANYAPYVEFGTGGSVLVPKGWEEVAMEFKGKGIRTINLPARPFLIPAFEKNVKLMEQRIQSQFNSLKII